MSSTSIEILTKLYEMYQKFVFVLQLKMIAERRECGGKHKIWIHSLLRLLKRKLLYD